MKTRLITFSVLAATLAAFPLSAAIPAGPEEGASPGMTPPSPRREEPNIILIFLDSLRADHLNCYGYGRETSPAIDDLARRGVLVRNVIAPAPGTFPSVHSIITSRVASRFFLSPRLALPEEELTLTEILKAGGWTTAGFSSNPLICGRSEQGRYEGGFEQGFDLFDDTGPDGRRWGWTWKTPEGIINKAIPWLKDHGRERFFLFLYIMDPHDHYRSPEPFNRLYDPDYRGRKMVSKGNASHYERKLLRGEDPRLTDRDIRHLEALYDGEIAYADGQIGRLLEVLKELGIDQNTLIIVTSDHGEEFFEHGGLKHCYTLYREQLDIPLVLCWPDKLPAGVVVDGPLIQGIDLVPTILDLVGIGVPEVMEGVSVKPLFFSGTAPDLGYALSEAPFIDAKALITLEWKYIHYFQTDLLHQFLSPKYTSGPRLYNLIEDPREETNLIDQHPEVAADMLKRLLEIIPAPELERVGGERSLRLDRSSLEKLKSLGYLR